ncbi:MAG: ABC transporter permease [Armatimonadota bacterium]|nr:ABC transporter permease [Armatimonadota bacterium]MDR7550590.1 ABC transporter permease [Armatimonadota bacterium]
MRLFSPKGAYRFWQRNAFIFRRIFPESVAVNFLEPVIYLLAMGFGIGAYLSTVAGLPYLTFVATGLVAASAMFGATFECTYNAYVQMYYEKAYDGAITTPLGIEDVVVGEILWGATRSVLYGTVFLVVIALFGVVRSILALLIPPLFFLSGLMFSVIAMTFTAINPSIDYFTFYFALFITPMFMFSGVFFPLDALPGWVSVAAWLTPLSHVVHLTRALALGTPGPRHVADLTWLSVVTVALFPLPVVLMRRRLIK